MNSRGDSGPGGPANPGQPPKDTAGDRPERLHAPSIGGPEGRPPPTPVDRIAEEAERAGAETTPAQTLTSFDWLSTIADELVLVSDRMGNQPAAAKAPSEPPSARASDFADLPLDAASASILGQVVLGYSPIIDEHRGVIATRLTLVPVRADAVLDTGALLRAVGEVWPAGSGVVSLNVVSEPLLKDLLRAKPNPNVMIEVPASLAGAPDNAQALLEIASRGNTLLIKGRPERELPRAVLPCFKWSIVDFADDRRLGGAAPPSGVARSIPHLQTGVRTMAQLRLSFSRGAIAVIGWPIHESLTSFQKARPDLRVVLEMISRIDRGEATAAIAQSLMRDPLLGFELLRYTNAAPSGPLQLEAGSFHDAISILGHQHLRRWLAGILGQAGDEVLLKPVNFAALRRGLLMRLLAADSSDAQTRDELFMCGAFSLLDRILAKPVGELMRTLVLPERVRQALVERRGPFLPMLELARAIESEVPHDIRAAANAAFVSPLEINRALLRTLHIASRMERASSGS